MSAFTRFIGGSPLEVLIKLIVLSFVVGIILAALNIDPLDIIKGIENIIRRIYELGWDSLIWAWRYLVLGAVVVVPIWFVLRILNFSRRS
ncbi:MAG: DUF6460 domain-containing protein [Pseudomonadota bacterium]